MTPERWQKIESVFQSAVEIDEQEREAFLVAACAGDEDLAAEVNKLLVDLKSADRFIETPVWSDSSLLSTTAKKMFSDSIGRAEKRGAFNYTGRQIGPYRLERELGRGGMGAVYLAERTDGEFRQRVAVKLIKRGMDSDYIIRRFRHERQILASFEHPYIARLLDGGTTDDGIPYFVMEYIEGDTLYNYCDAKHLETRDRLKVFQKVCSAIEYAHEKQIIHRDIKPSNILIRRDGSPKLLDFGIAKILDPDLIHESINPTASMLRMMTPEYASPEQVLGENVTPSSDIYSLGLLLYELVTGHRPYSFAGRALHEISRVICEVMPSPPSAVLREDDNLLAKYAASKASFLEVRSTSEAELEKVLRSGLDDIIMKAIAKSPQDRYSSAGEFSKDISRYLKGEPLTAPRYAARPQVSDDLFLRLPENSKAVAVLPFKFINLGDADDSEHKFLGLGLADALIMRLSKVRRFVVRPTSSIIGYGSDTVDPISAGRDLGVDYILAGNIKKAGNRLRTSVQLLNVRENAAVWATSIDETLSDVLTLEETVANKVVEVLLPQLTGSELADFSKRGTDVPEAFEHYLRGRYHFNSFTEDGLAKAFLSFHSAIAADPGYAAAFAGIADYYNWLGIIGVLPPKECFQPAIEAASKAVELDESLSEAHASLGFSLHAGNYDWSRAEHHLRRAIELNPGNANAYVWYSIVLFTQARFDEGLSFALRGVDLDPLTPFNHHNVGWGLYYARRYDDSAQRYEKMVQDFPNHNLGYYGLSKVHRIAGETRKALAENQTANKLAGGSIFTQLAHAECLAADGQPEAAITKLRELEKMAADRFVSPYQLALVYCYLNDRDNAIKNLKSAKNINDPWLNWMGVEPVFDLLRGDNRFDAILEEVGYRVFFSNYAVSSANLDTTAPNSRRGANNDKHRLHDVTTLVIDDAEKTDSGEVRESPPARGTSRAYMYATAVLVLVVLAGGTWLLTRSFADESSAATATTYFGSPTIVVLPFSGATEADRSLGVGLADALSGKLGGVKSVNVISAGTGRAVAELDPPSISRLLGIPFVLRGSVRRNEGSTKLAVELINASTGAVLWSQPFDGPDAEISSLQTQIADGVLRALRVDPLPLERQQLSKRYSGDVEAYEAYLSGRSLLARRSRENLRGAIDAFQRAISEDPGFPLPYVGYADAKILLNTYDIEAKADVYREARQAIETALRLDDDLAEAHASLGYIKFFHDRDRAGAELEFRRSIQLNPSYSQARHWFALALSYMRRPVEALSEAQTAKKLDPRSPSVKAATAIVYYMDSKYWEAVNECEEALAIDPNFVPALKVQRWAFTMLGDKEKALAVFDRELRASGGSLEDPGWKIIQLQIDPNPDRRAAIKAVEAVAEHPTLRSNDRGFAFEVALAFSAVGENTRAIEYLERAESSLAHSFNLVEVEPRFANLRSMPQFQKLVVRLRQPLSDR